MSTRLGAAVAAEELVVADGVVGARCSRVEDVGYAAEEADPAARGEDDALYNRRPCSSGDGATSWTRCELRYKGQMVMSDGQ